MSEDLAVIEEGELVEHQPAPLNLFGVHEPEQVVEKAASVATALAGVIEQRELYKMIQGKKHVLVDGWCLLGSMLGVYPQIVWTRKLGDGWEARCEARTRDGALVGAAEAECLLSEKMWKGRDDYALRSMAQTRATSKALRMPLGFVMQLAGYQATPMEEMPQSGDAAPSKAARMRERIIEIARTAEAEQQVRDAVHAFFGDPLEDLDEADLTRVGQDLRLWVESGLQDDFKLAPF